MRTMSMALAAAGLLAVGAASARAADPAYCEAYATLAVGQYLMALAKGLPNIVWPRWSADANAHRTWCLQPSVTRQTGDIEIGARHSVIAAAPAMIMPLGVDSPTALPRRGSEPSRRRN